MTDTRPHFWFYSDTRIYAENLDPNTYYLCGYIDNNTHILFSIFEEQYGNIQATTPDSSVAFVIAVNEENFTKLTTVLQEHDTMVVEEMLSYDSTIEYTMSNEFSYPNEVYLGEEPSPTPTPTNVTWSINNKTVQSLQIGQKEVQSIERVSDSKIIYSKGVTHDYALTITGDTIVESGSSITLTATLTDGGSAVSGETVSIYLDGVRRIDAITDSEGTVTYTYVGRGRGDVVLCAEYGSLTQTYIIEDYYEFVNTSNSKDVSSSRYSAPLQITGQVKTNGTWGGTRIYGYTGSTRQINYCFLSNNSGNSSESEKIRYNVSSSYENFKIILQNNTVTLYINDVQRASVSADTSYDILLSGGSSANPVSLKDVRIKAL